MTDLVKSYLPSAFAFIYVINSSNAGGLQPDRVATALKYIYPNSNYNKKLKTKNPKLFSFGSEVIYEIKHTNARKYHVKMLYLRKMSNPFLSKNSQRFL